MRRSWISGLSRKSRRAGVTLRVIIRNVSAVRPVKWVIRSTGLAPRLPVRMSRTSQANGPSDATNAIGLPTRLPHCACVAIPSPHRLSPSLTVPHRPSPSEVPPEIHPGIETRHLLSVAVERQRRSLEQLPNPPLPLLAPARMIHRRIHVGVEPVLLGQHYLPGVARLLPHQPNA